MFNNTHTHVLTQFVYSHKTCPSSRKIASIVIVWYCLQGYTMVTLSLCELKCDLLYFLNICNDTISQHYACQNYEIMLFNSQKPEYATHQRKKYLIIE